MRTITGTIVDVVGLPIPNIDIKFTLVNADIKPTDSFDAVTYDRVYGNDATTTDANGNFTISLYENSKLVDLTYYLVVVDIDGDVPFISQLPEGVGGLDWLEFRMGGVAVTPAQIDIMQNKVDEVRALFDSFESRHLGTKATAPTVDNDGGVLLEGAIYWNSSTKKHYTWNGTGWEVWNIGVTLDTAQTISGAKDYIIIPKANGTDLTTLDTAQDITAEKNYTVPPKVDGVSIGGYSGFKNYIINGGFNVWQRNSSFIPALNHYFTADRWRIKGSLASVTKEYIGQDFALKLTKTNTTEVYTGITTYLEYGELEHLVGKTCTISFQIILHQVMNTEGRITFASRGAGDAADGADISVSFAECGIDINNVGGIQNGSFTFVVPPSTTYYSYRLFFIGNGVTGTLTYSFSISNVQLELGSVATNFEYRPYTAELQLCKRFYQQVTLGDRISATAANQFICNFITLAIPMRVIPTSTTLSVGNELNINAGSMNIWSSSALRYETTSVAVGNSYFLGRVESLNAELL